LYTPREKRVFELFKERRKMRREASPKNNQGVDPHTKRKGLFQGKDYKSRTSYLKKSNCEGRTEQTMDQRFEKRRPVNQSWKSSPESKTVFRTGREKKRH